MGSAFVYVTDLHLRTRRPRSRKDESYLDALVDKVRFVVGLAEDVDGPVVFGGDLLDSPTLCPVVTMALLDSLGPAEWFCVLGNHDLVGGNVSSYCGGPIEVLERAGKLVVLGGEEGAAVKVAGFVVRPFHYYTGIDLQRRFDVGGPAGMPRVAVPHSFVLNHEAVFDHVRIESVETDADLVLCSHYHPGWPTVEHDGTLFCAPGALARTSVVDAGRIPKALVISHQNGGFQVEQVQVPHQLDPFVQCDPQKGFSDQVEEFLGMFAEDEGDAKVVVDLDRRLEEIAKEVGASSEVLEEAKRKLGARR